MGRSHSEETKAKMRAAHAARRAEIREQVGEEGVAEFFATAPASAKFRSVVNGWESWQIDDPEAKCKVEICVNLATVRGLCGGHFYRATKDPRGLRPEVPLRKHAPAGQARHLDASGYVRVSVPEGTPGRNKSGKMLEHRWVMQQHLGRPLLPWETIHHKNAQRADNRLENLELRVGPHGVGATESHCVTCSCFPEAVTPV